MRRNLVRIRLRNCCWRWEQRRFGILMSMFLVPCTDMVHGICIVPNCVIRLSIGRSSSFLRNNFPHTMAMDSLPPLRILARNQTAVDAYWLWLQKYPQSCSDRPEIAEFANQYGVLFQTDNSFWLNKILKPDKKRAHSSIDLRDDRGRSWSSQEIWPQAWHSSSSWQHRSWNSH